MDTHEPIATPLEEPTAEPPLPSGRPTRRRSPTWLVVAITSICALIAVAIAVGQIRDAGAVLRDDFEGAHHWTEDDDPLVTERFVDGAYEVMIKQDHQDQMSRHFFDQHPSMPRLTFAADVTVVKEEGAQLVGVACWSNAAAGYLFALSPDEGYALLLFSEDAEPTPLDEGDGPAFHEGDTLRLSIECRGGGAESSEVVGRVNGEELASASDAGGLDGFVAVGLWSATEQAGGTVRWDNALAETD